MKKKSMLHGLIFLRTDYAATFLLTASSREVMGRGGSFVQEAELIRAAKQGDRQALIQLLKEVETPLYRTAFYMLKNEQDALDATQEALIKIYKNIHTFELKANF